MWLVQGRNCACSVLVGKNLKNRDHLQVIDTDGWDYVKMGLKRVGWEGVKWINLAPNRVQWRGL